jgi:hypothetical protein
MRTKEIMRDEFYLPRGTAGSSTGHPEFGEPSTTLPMGKV